MNEKARRVVWTLVRIVSALAIGQVAFFCLMWLLPLMTGVVASEMGCLCLSAFAFFCLRGSFVGGYRVGNCLPSGNRRELVCTAKLVVAARL